MTLFIVFMRAKAVMCGLVRLLAELIILRETSFVLMLLAFHQGLPEE